MASEQIDDGGPAFPSSINAGANSGEWTYATAYAGMSLRDWFAGKAMDPILKQLWETADEPVLYSNVAHDCYKFADAMLKARKVQP